MSTYTPGHESSLVMTQLVEHLKNEDAIVLYVERKTLDKPSSIMYNKCVE